MACPATIAFPSAVIASESDSLSTRFDFGAYAASLGARDAPVVVVEFVDYRCGFCAQQARAAFDEIQSRYVDSGLVRYLAVDVPLLGPEAERDATVARCAGAQDGYWLVHRALLIDAKFPRNEPTDLDRLARAAGLDRERLVACVDSGDQRLAMHEATARALAHRVNATPMFFFGYPVPGEHAMTIERHIAGSVGTAPIVDAIEALLNSLRERQQRHVTDR